MAEPVSTRQQLRRAIARQARMTFFRRYQAGQLTPDTTSSTAELICSSLVQEDHFWQNGYVYVSAGEQERRIADFEASRKAIIPEYAFSPAPADSDFFEIFEIWPPSFIHDAINQANREGGQYYPDVVVDETIVLEEDKLEYALSGLAKQPLDLLQVWIENTGESKTGTADGGDSTYIQLETTQSLADVTADWWLSIYGGTGKGQLRQVGSVNDGLHRVLPSSAFATNPDSTSKYRLWDPTVQEEGWDDLSYFGTDVDEYPTELWLRSNYFSRRGLRVRLVYTHVPDDLSADSSETEVPLQYIMYKALSILHDQVVGDNRADRQKHNDLAEGYDRLARDYSSRMRRYIPARTVRMEGTTHTVWPSSPGNPMDW